MAAILSGMTGFARVDGAHEAWSWAVEARSVNGRNLETRFRGPPGFDGLERVGREAAQARFQRGQITIGLQAKRAEGPSRVRVNTAELERLIALARPYVAAGEAAAPRFDGLLALRGVLDAAEDNDDEPVRRAVEARMAQSIEQAVDALKLARQEEGAALTPVLATLTEAIAGLVTQAELVAAAQGPALKARFAKRMAELVGEGAGGLEDRLAQEAALLVGKADVREELDRLSVHVAAARSLIADGGAAGRRLDFLAQEFMREANTLCSKSASSPLTALGLDLKAAVEQLREQIQNVE